MNRHGPSRLAASRAVGQKSADFTPRNRASRGGDRRSSWRSIPYLTLGLLVVLGVLMMLSSERSPPGKLADATGATDAPVASAPDAMAVAAPAGPHPVAATPAISPPIQQERASADAASPVAPAEPPAATAAAPIGTWERIEDAPAAFTLSAYPDTGVTAGLVELPEREEAVQHADGGGRDDAISLGTVEGEPLLRLSIYRPGREVQPPTSFYIELARRAGEAGQWVERFSALPPIDARFGEVSAATVVFGSREGQRACIAFRHLATDQTLRVSGWLCGAGLKQPGADEVACVLDGIRWIRPEEPTLATLFTGDVKARAGCRSAAEEASTGSITPEPAPKPAPKRRH